MNALELTMHEQVKTLLNGWNTRIEKITGRLRDLSETTESDFLAIGSDLYNFSMQTDELSALSSSVVTALTGEQFTEAVAEIVSLVDHLQEFGRQCRGDLSCSLDQLHKAKRVIHRLETPLEEARKIVQMLMMLGISTRIESARLKGGDAGFTNLARDIRELSSLINQKVDKIRDEGEFLEIVMEDTGEEVFRMQAGFSQRLRQILDGVRANLSLLKKVYDASSAAAQHCADRFRNISGNIGEVVMSLQFHDITRQQLEHVVEAIDEIKLLLGDDNLSPTGWNPEDTYLQEVIRKIGDICRIQRAQVRNSLAHLASASGIIIDSLKNIITSVDELASKVEEVTGDSCGGDTSILALVETGINSASESLYKNSESQQALAKTIKNAVEKTDVISVSINEIDDTGSHIELIALNARVKAAQAGAEGVALGVIAESIQKVSLDSRTQTTRLLDILEEILGVTESLKTNIDASITSQKTEMEGILSDFRRLITVLSNINGEIKPVPLQIRDLRQEVAERIIETTSGISIHTIASDILNGVIEEFTKMLEEATELVPTLATGELIDDLEDLKRRYTMESERKVHLSALGPEIPEDTDMEIYSFAGDDLGDNVELF